MRRRNFLKLSLLATAISPLFGSTPKQPTPKQLNDDTIPKSSKMELMFRDCPTLTCVPIH